MGPLRRRSRDSDGRDLSARRRVPVRPAHLRGLRRFRASMGRSGRQPDLDGAALSAQVRGIDRVVRSEAGQHDRPLGGRRGGRPGSEGQARRRAAGARQWRVVPLAARQRTRRRDQPFYLSGGRRPGNTPVPRHGQGRRARIGRIAEGHTQWRHDPGLPPNRASAVRVSRQLKGTTMAELLVDFVSSLDGYGAGEGWPGWWGLQGPEYLAWLGAQPEADYTVLMGANTYRLMSGFAAEGEPGTEALADMSKVVFSTSLTAPLSWPNTRLVAGDAVEAVRAMKENATTSMRTIGSLAV